ncbi:hypothetical protein BDV98DRAFT_584244 [Pterulicium gracile]|uniref:Uncharacterized protein n=1 Tax=Pterulicium gracile TaxID=1884261 RepID=A0A5C3QCJ2_9AGAR|nr:hypothetical protein BDV98DRAFT_584244 [Pterula gracilis]
MLQIFLATQFVPVAIPCSRLLAQHLENYEHAKYIAPPALFMLTAPQMIAARSQYSPSSNLNPCFLCLRVGAAHIDGKEVDEHTSSASKLNMHAPVGDQTASRVPGMVN